jgi:beta-mannosidase
MITIYDLSRLQWSLSGWMPNVWPATGGAPRIPEIPEIAAEVPGSVQKALADADLLPDWNVGMNSRSCEWVENRDWVFEADLPDGWLKGESVALCCDGLDGFGYVALNRKVIGRFRNAFMPHRFELAPHAAGQSNRLSILFEPPPRWLGQVGYTSQMTQWKPRFNYGWDWMPRLVQIGIWDGIRIAVADGPRIDDLRITTDSSEDGRHRLSLSARIADPRGLRLHVTLRDADQTIAEQSVDPAADGVAELRWDSLSVKPWWPSGMGDQPLYQVSCSLIDLEGREHDRAVRRVGFRTIQWEQCDGAPAGADPWICNVNGRSIFLQGVNWTPIRPNFADVRPEQVQHRLEAYRDIGCNILRVWGGATLETEGFYDLCDELGLLVWQEFPLSSSGTENWPPDDEVSIRELSEVAHSYIRRRQHHVSLIIWCGGNELQGGLDGSREGAGKPVDASHPLLAAFNRIVETEDPTRRYLPTSSSGPRFSGNEADFGKGLHWDVHGPWRLPKPSEVESIRYWRNDDALFRSEVGAPGASPVDVIEATAGELNPLPATRDNPLWRRTAWWIDWSDFEKEHGREPLNLPEYVEWSQQRQARALAMAAEACKGRYPRCGGFIVWMGHDAFPCTANTSVFDFHGHPKPAAIALAKVFRGE